MSISLTTKFLAWKTNTDILNKLIILKINKIVPSQFEGVLLQPDGMFLFNFKWWNYNIYSVSKLFVLRFCAKNGKSEDSDHFIMDF